MGLKRMAELYVKFQINKKNVFFKKKKKKVGGNTQALTVLNEIILEIHG